MIELKNANQLVLMRNAGRIVAETLALIREHAKPGVTTLELDRIAEKYIRAQGAIPAFKGYNGFPATLCTSVNEQVVHGIPGLRILESGDIISIDCGALIEGYFGDAAVTLPIGEVGEDLQKLLRVTEESLMQGIAQAKVGNRLYDVSNAVQTHVEANGFSVVRDYVGHGIGKAMHEDPQIPNFGKPGRGPRLEVGMALAIEPMVNMGTYEVQTLKDRWTVVTKDNRPSAHFEHTVAITENGLEILTRC
ncbi:MULTISPECIES: type I methionyl aminopeptidase [Desulfosporosinus]|uniref:Methionine aminopeptidase n=1 Tax=Desulfosporosinus lacus DSM 15449 TaxID=1121420 RepID=A0A1M6CLG7_9FIRM|nr:MULTISPECIES: type I methionyl aminopeptidase [Desulfosporosinus]MCB8815690.1 type I methionyl aminopeptidase [Desulfosporosinus sp. SRJS8]MCO5388156.1 type I methionyl aminopeptidase [Desulfosporosinus sp.]MDA8220691.1 type I methionyl aminopeptidase [Desulfitobacterium hafniense]SHI61773.1 methionyl aminopeptidase [Desulfosporosinus lacus DSM 15449]